MLLIYVNYDDDVHDEVVEVVITYSAFVSLFLLAPPSNVFFFQPVLISWVVTLSSCLIWQIISYILLPNEYRFVYAWITLGNIATDRLTEDADFGKQKIILSEEAHFNLGGYVNKQTCRVENPTHPKRVTVFCRFWSRGIIRLFFFENEQGELVTVNGDCYRAMLKEFLFTKIEEEDIGNIEVAVVL